VISAEFIWKGVFSQEEDGLNVGRRLGHIKRVCRCTAVRHWKYASELGLSSLPHQQLMLRYCVSFDAVPLTCNIIPCHTRTMWVLPSWHMCRVSSLSNCWSKKKQNLQNFSGSPPFQEKTATGASKCNCLVPFL